MVTVAQAANSPQNISIQASIRGFFRVNSEVES